jgi:3-carboxy-cis,cis-muconate cycloisomerase
VFAPLTDVFGDEEIGELLSERSLVGTWLEVERALAAAQADHGVIPERAADAVAAAATPDAIDLPLLRERSRRVGYPILPLLEQLAAASPEAGKHLHWGATTQDIMDTGLALTAVRVLDRIGVLLDDLGDSLANLADAHRASVMPGRTHAQPAVPVTFGGKLAVLLTELARHRDRLRRARRAIGVVELFGAAGTAAAFGQESAAVRKGTARRLELGGADVPWHTARDGVAEAAFAAAALAASCAKLGREVVELSRPEIGELAEGGGHLRGASSTMPQKTNPIDSEATIGMALVAGQQVGVLLTAMQAPHERAAGEWQAEWDAFALALAAAGGAVARAAELARNLRVHPERMRANLLLDGGAIMAEAAMMAVARIVGRAEAHDLVYTAAATARLDGISLSEGLERTLPPEVAAALPPLPEILDPARYLGETERVVDAALTAWHAVIPSAEAGTAQR